MDGGVGLAGVTGVKGVAGLGLAIFVESFGALTTTDDRVEAFWEDFVCLERGSGRVNRSEKSSCGPQQGEFSAEG